MVTEETGVDIAPSFESIRVVGPTAEFCSSEPAASCDNGFVESSPRFSFTSIFSRRMPLLDSFSVVDDSFFDVDDDSFFDVDDGSFFDVDDDFFFCG